MRRVLEKFRFAFIAEIISVISGGVLMIALARLLNPDGYGLFTLSLSVLGVAKLFSKLGFAESASRYIAEYKEKDPTMIPKILVSSLIMTICSISISYITLYLFRGRISSLMGEAQLSAFIEVGVVFIVLGTLSSFFRKVLQGFEFIEVASVALSIERITRVILSVGFVLLGYGAIGALIGYSISFILTVLIGSVYICQHLLNISKLDKYIFNNMARRIFEYSLPLSITNASGVIEKRSDILLIGYFLGPTYVAYYTVSKQMTEFTNAPVSAYGYTVSPMYSSEQSKDNKLSPGELYEDSLKGVLFLYMPAALGIAILAEPTLSVILGEEYIEAAPILAILSVLALLKAITSVTSSGLDYLGRAKDRAKIKTVMAVINIILNILLLPVIGVIGAAIATVVSYSIYTAFNISIMYDELKISFQRIANPVFRLLFVCVMMSVVVYYTSNQIEGASGLVISILSGVLVWFIGGLVLNLWELSNTISKVYSLL